MPKKQLFWLHVKKSAGMTTRALLKPYYTIVDKSHKPKTFIQATPEEYNDILNNYRVVLGDYQFKRCLFAKTYLYPTQWEQMYSFAFSREPVDRCVSMFRYLYWEHAGAARHFVRTLKKSIAARRVFTTSYAFDVFLDYAQEARSSESIYHPLGLHFTTHTAPMWDDITDLDGNILLSEVFRLEALVEGINKVFRECGIDHAIESSNVRINESRGRGIYTPTRQQIGKIEQIYAKDFEIYEASGRGSPEAL